MKQLLWSLLFVLGVARAHAEPSCSTSFRGMNSVVVTSDVHLRDASDPQAKRFIQWLRQDAQRFDTLVLVGDIFDFWMATTPAQIRKHNEVLRALAETVERGTRVESLAGNHDPNLGDYFAKSLGVQVHPRFLDIRVGSLQVHFEHGDLLPGTVPLAHRILTPLLRNGITESVIGALPEKVVSALESRFGYDRERKRDPVKDSLIRNRYRNAVVPLFREGQDVVVLGHLHLPDDWIWYDAQGRPHRYFNLGVFPSQLEIHPSGVIARTVGGAAP